MFPKIAVLITLVLTLALSACGGSSSTGPSSLSGTWKSDSPSMTAHISNNQIEIDIVSDGSSALYWKGTMPQTASDGSQFVSAGDTKAMDSALLASTLHTKKFTYKDGKLIFQWSILGTTRTVELEQ